MMADENEPTAPMDLRALWELLEDIGDDPDTPENEVAEARKRIPEPALVRGAILAAVNLVGVIVGSTLDIAWVEPVVYLYGVLGPVGLALWIRTKVTPVKK